MKPDETARARGLVPSDVPFESRGLWWGEAILPLIPLAVFLGLASHLPTVAGGDPVDIRFDWVPSLAVQLSFRLDGLGLLFGLLISGIGTLVFTYAPGYMEGDPERGRLYVWLVAFMLAMLGVVLADNVIVLFVCWELTSLTSYLLIGHKHSDSEARESALQALLVTGLGGLCLLGGLLLLASLAGSLELTTIVRAGLSTRESALLRPAIFLVLLGAFTKSAQTPFHFWLPSAMAAPTPVSAYLHSATMVKAGVYLLARLHPGLDGIPLWNGLTLGVGVATAVVGGMLALRHTDLKKILAYSTVSTLGMLTCLIGMGTSISIKAAMVLLVSHSLYKGAFFLIAGAIDHASGSRDIRMLRSLGRVMPIVAIAAALAGLSAAGLPPTGGFLSKELVYESSLAMEGGAWPVTGCLLIAGTCSVVVAGCLALTPFFAKARAEPPSRLAMGPPPLGGTSHDGPGHESADRAPHAVGWRLAVPPLILAVGGLAIGWSVDWFTSWLIAPAVAALDHEGPIQLKLWHGIGWPLVLSGVTLALGVAGYRAGDRVRMAISQVDRIAPWGPAAAYAQLLQILKIVAAWQTRLLQHGRLRIYLLVFLLAFIALVGFSVVYRVHVPDHREWLDLRPYELFIPILIFAATGLALATNSRLAAVCALGVIGYAVAMLFVMYGSPDLAMTQMAIETLTVILFVLVIYRLPKFARLSTRASWVRDALVATAAGGVMAAVTLASTMAHVPSRLTPYFVEQSLPAAKGRNVVNVILVDFRGLDTLGEITVLAVAALGIYALMRLRTVPQP